MIEVDCQLLMYPSPKQAYNISWTLNTSCTSQKAELLHTCRLHTSVWSLSSVHVYSCTGFWSSIYSGEGIYIFKGCIYPILPVTNTQTLEVSFRQTGLEVKRSKTKENDHAPDLFMVFRMYWKKSPTKSQSVFSQAH